MKNFLKKVLPVFLAVLGIGAFTACGDDNDDPVPSPDEYTKGTFTFCYGALESELDIATFKFKFTYLDEKGKEKTDESIVDKEGFVFDNPNPLLRVDGMKFYKQSVALSSLPASVKCEVSIVMKGGEQLTKDEYDLAQTSFVYFLPSGAQYAQTWSSSSVVRYEGVEKDKLSQAVDLLQKDASNTFLIQRTGTVSLYK